MEKFDKIDVYGISSNREFEVFFIESLYDTIRECIKYTVKIEDVDSYEFTSYKLDDVVNYVIEKIREIRHYEIDWFWVGSLKMLIITKRR